MFGLLVVVMDVRCVAAKSVWLLLCCQHAVHDEHRRNVTGRSRVRYFAPELTGAAPRCSLASDVFSAGLIVVEMVTGVCVFTHAGEKAAVAAEDVGGAQAKAATRDAAAAGAKAALVSQATERLKTVLAFAQDSPLTLEAMQMLAQACTKDDPACRCSFRDVQQLCRPVGQQGSGGARGGGAANG